MEYEGSLSFSQIMPLATILSQMNPMHILMSYFRRSILILFSHLRLCLPSVHFPSGFQTTFLFEFSLRITCPNHLIFLDFVIIMIPDESITYEALPCVIFSGVCFFLIKEARISRYFSFVNVLTLGSLNERFI